MNVRELGKELLDWDKQDSDSFIDDKWTDELAEKCEDVLSMVSESSSELSSLREIIEKLEELTDLAKMEEGYLSGVLIPKLLGRANVRSFTTENGLTVSCKETVFASLPKLDLVARKRAMDWLNANGGGSLIKDNLIVESPTQDLISSLQDRYKIERKMDVNTNSLKSFVSELLGYKKGSVAQMDLEEVPVELHAFVKRETIIKTN